MSGAAQAAGCGEFVTHGDTRTRYAYVSPASPSGTKVALVLLAGGGGHLQLGDDGCARALTGSSLVRSLPLFQAAGWATALVDAPSDHGGEDGLGGFRMSSEHAQDLGRVDADLHRRAPQPSGWSAPAAVPSPPRTPRVASAVRSRRTAWC